MNPRSLVAIIVRTVSSTSRVAMSTRPATLQSAQKCFHKERANRAIDARADDLRKINHSIWALPELMFEERYAHDLLSLFLRESGFSVRGNYVLETAFRAEYVKSESGPNIAVVCEYDALPEIGHACGHNLIAECGIAAALGIKAALESDDQLQGKLTVIGSPAEEGGGGKIHLLNAGAFDDVDAALMSHPATFDAAEKPYLACDIFKVKFIGKAAHASVAPWEGQNALDAAVLAYQNISCLRQQCKPPWRIHGIITNGGLAAGIIPTHTELEYRVRAPHAADLKILTEKVKRCFEAAAMATSCQVEFLPVGQEPYLDVLYNGPMKETYIQNCLDFGIDCREPVALAGSTDMGNVSYKIPAIHPNFSIGSKAAIHTEVFAEDADTDLAHQRTLMQGKILAGTALDIFKNKTLLQEIKDDFREKTQSDNA